MTMISLQLLATPADDASIIFRMYCCCYKAEFESCSSNICNCGHADNIQLGRGVRVGDLASLIFCPEMSVVVLQWKSFELIVNVHNFIRHGEGS